MTEPTTTTTGAARVQRHPAVLIAELAGPLLLYYGARAAGLSPWTAMIAGAGLNRPAASSCPSS